MNSRLPKDVLPKTYDLHVTADPDVEEFSGTARIALDVVRPVTSVTLHAAELSFQEVTLAGRTLASADIKADTATQRATFAAALPAGPAELVIKYSGRLNHQMRGLYQSRAKHQGQDENYLFTQFEATDARRMFPCFDEPDFKAVFALTVTAPARFTVLSNMPRAKASSQGGRQTVAFKPTPRMSTYLLALAVARLSSIKRMVSGVEVRVWTRPEDIGQAGFALDAAEASLKGLNRYFDLPYQLPKMDLVAVPDFAAGAMENWGAIFFRDSAILIDPKLSSTRARRRVAEVVTHEIVHQWFGDLVTMKWWDDLWLNEAFATWLAYKIVDQWQPRWNIWLDFEHGTQAALRTDSLRNTRAIIAAVASEAEIEQMFDVLTYEKGGAILRMIEGYLGEKDFRAGIRAYMRRYKGKNTAADDLWRELEKASGAPVLKMAADWLRQPGYPIVKAELGSDGHLALSQRRFDAHGASASEALWTIPVVVDYQRAGEKARSARVILKDRSAAVKLAGKKKAAWLYVNQNETGFYRSALDDRALPLDNLMKLAPSERMGLLNHRWALARNGEAGIAAFLETVAALQKDASRIILEDEAMYLSALRDILPDEADRPALGKFTEELFASRLKKLGLDGKKSENDDVKLSRAAVFSALAELSPSAALQKATDERLARYFAEATSVEPTMVMPLLSAGARLGGAERFALYGERMKKATTPEQRNQLLAALAQFRDPELARRLLAMTLSDDIRGQDAWAPIGGLLRNKDTQETAWNWVKSNWGAIRKKVGTKGSERIIQSTAALWREEWLADVRQFFNDPQNREDAASRSLEQSLESIEIGIRFKSAQGAALAAWLKSR